uniref:Uncharacterized protein n=1 Tax=Pristhesancus plagipennis TaxID=1955184 RepID=A0A2K8JPP6_PRIPG|nr:secreted hypothetical protein [Pristhesancus plagipennis]
MWWCVALLWTSVAAAASTQTNTLGQPEYTISLGLPSDDDAFNHLSPMPYASGTYHFVSSAFPEIDSRGFHESVFDGIGDYYPSWTRIYYQRLNKNNVPRELDGFRGLRRKRSVLVKGNNDNATVLNDNKIKVTKREVNKRLMGGRHVRGMEMGSSGFHGDAFHSDFGDFTTMRKRRSDLTKRASDLTRLVFRMQNKRRPEMDSMGFHGDTFAGGFGDFDTMKRNNAAAGVKGVDSKRPNSK